MSDELRRKIQKHRQLQAAATQLSNKLVTDEDEPVEHES
jgi:hypothetical protein